MDAAGDWTITVADVEAVGIDVGVFDGWSVHILSEGVGPCDPTGKCCFCNGLCKELTEPACADEGGEYKGDDSTCPPPGCTQYRLHNHPDGLAGGNYGMRLDGVVAGDPEADSTFNFDSAGSAMFMDDCPGPETCDHEVELFDTFGDGWDGATMDVLVNGDLVLDDIGFGAGASALFTFSASTGDSITTVYTPGACENEHLYEIRDGNGTVIGSDGPAPGPGIAATGNCPGGTLHIFGVAERNEDGVFYDIDFNYTNVLPVGGDGGFADIRASDCPITGSGTITPEGGNAIALEGFCGSFGFAFQFGDEDGEQPFGRNIQSLFPGHRPQLAGATQQRPGQALDACLPVEETARALAQEAARHRVGGITFKKIRKSS